MTHGSATNSHFPQEEIPLTSDSSGATGGVFSHPASVIITSYVLKPMQLFIWEMLSQAIF